MKKIILAVGLIIITALTIYSLSKNNTGEKINNTKFVESNNSPSNKMEQSDTTQVSDLRYIDYSDTSFNQATNMKRVYFFYAKWCPSCMSADDEFIQNADKIPSDVILFKTNYDTEKELKTKYGITYQHTFVYVDSFGKAVKKWNGGGITELISNTAQE